MIDVTFVFDDFTTQLVFNSASNGKYTNLGNNLTLTISNFAVTSYTQGTNLKGQVNIPLTPGISFEIKP